MSNHFETSFKNVKDMRKNINRAYLNRLRNTAGRQKQKLFLTLRVNLILLLCNNLFMNLFLKTFYTQCVLFFGKQVECKFFIMLWCIFLCYHFFICVYENRVWQTVSIVNSSFMRVCKSVKCFSLPAGA